MILPSKQTPSYVTCILSASSNFLRSQASALEARTHCVSRTHTPIGGFRVTLRPIETSTKATIPIMYYVARISKCLHPTKKPVLMTAEDLTWRFPERRTLDLVVKACQNPASYWASVCYATIRLRANSSDGPISQLSPFEQQFRGWTALQDISI